MLVMALASWGVGCGGSGGGDRAAPSTTVPTVEPPPTNPIDADGPDPDVLAANGSYWMFTTTADHLRVPVRGATRTGRWSAPTEALPERAAWARANDVWAPGVIQVGGRYVMWFGAPTVPNDSVSQCIGVAVADAPGGPYTPVGDKPVICGKGGPTIDPFPWRAPDGRLYIAWTQYRYKTGEPTQILASRLNASGTATVGEPRVLLTDPQGWEAIILENPALFAQSDGTVRLLYSGNFFTGADYATGTATCKGPLGPCVRDTPGKPWLASTGEWKGPGGMSVFRGPHDQVWVTFHAWGSVVGYGKGGRRAPVVRPLSALPPLP